MATILVYPINTVATLLVPEGKDNIVQGRQSCLILITSILCMVLTSCMVGPNFRHPPSPRVSSYTEIPLPAKTRATPMAGRGGAAQYFLHNEDLPGDWWRLFHSHSINQLVRAGLANSPNLLAAQAALRQARENLNAQIGNSLWPAVNLQATAQRGKSSTASFASAGLSNIPGGGGGGNIFNLFNTSVNVSYILDVFGGQRRQVESVAAQLDYTRYQLIATYLTLTSNIVTTAITVASLQAQIVAVKDLIAAESNQLRILREQYRLGAIALSNVLTQETFTQQTMADLPPLQKSLAEAKHNLTTLLGIYPNSPLPPIKLSELTLPSKLPIMCPSELVRQRPDVLQAEALMHVASANIGVATANMLPQINLTASYGWTATVASQLFSPANNVWNMAAGVAQPLFRGGALFAQRRAAIAAYQQAAMQYRQAVLQAFQNVADALRAIEADARDLHAETIAERAARQSLNLVQQQYKLGGINYLALLIAQQQYQQARIRRIRAQASRYLDTVALFQALGGGWWETACRLCLRQQFVARQIAQCRPCLFGRKAA